MDSGVVHFDRGVGRQQRVCLCPCCGGVTICVPSCFVITRMELPQVVESAKSPVKEARGCQMHGRELQGCCRRGKW